MFITTTTTSVIMSLWLHRLPIVFTLVLTLAGKSFASSFGAPESQCGQMTPGHGYNPKRGSGPYNVTASTSTITAGGNISVTITGDRQFKGFFLRVQQGNNFVSGGQFELGDNGQFRCGGEGMTHTSNNLKDSVSFVWTAPSDLNPSTPIHFVATVVKKFRRYWVKIPSANIQVTSG